MRVALCTLFLIASARSKATDLVHWNRHSTDDNSLVERAAFNTSINIGGPRTVECNGDVYGNDLAPILDSCKEALDGFTDNRKQYTFGPHGTHNSFITPLRILSRKHFRHCPAVCMPTVYQC